MQNDTIRIEVAAALNVLSEPHKTVRSMRARLESLPNQLELLTTGGRETSARFKHGRKSYLLITRQFWDYVLKSRSVQEIKWCLAYLIKQMRDSRARFKSTEAAALGIGRRTHRAIMARLCSRFGAQRSEPAALTRSAQYRARSAYGASLVILGASSVYRATLQRLKPAALNRSNTETGLRSFSGSRSPSLMEKILNFEVFRSESEVMRYLEWSKLTLKQCCESLFLCKRIEKQSYWQGF